MASLSPSPASMPVGEALAERRDEVGGQRRSRTAASASATADVGASSPPSGGGAGLGGGRQLGGDGVDVAGRLLVGRRHEVVERRAPARLRAQPVEHLVLLVGEHPLELAGAADDQRRRAPRRGRSNGVGRVVGDGVVGRRRLRRRPRSAERSRANRSSTSVAVTSSSSISSSSTAASASSVDGVGVVVGLDARRLGSASSTSMSSSASTPGAIDDGVGAAVRELQHRGAGDRGRAATGVARLRRLVAATRRSAPSVATASAASSGAVGEPGVDRRGGVGRRWDRAPGRRDRWTRGRRARRR